MRVSTIVVLGVAVLAGAAALHLWSRVTHYQRRVRREITNELMRAIAELVVTFRLKHGRLPATLQETLDFDEPPKDPWGNDFVYAPSADGSFELRSLGADGVPGGSDADADISFVGPAPT
jgi:type II secretory pathway pseudopilin PulG